MKIMPGNLCGFLIRVKLIEEQICVCVDTSNIYACLDSTNIQRDREIDR